MQILERARRGGPKVPSIAFRAVQSETIYRREDPLLTPKPDPRSVRGSTFRIKKLHSRLKIRRIAFDVEFRESMGRSEELRGRCARPRLVVTSSGSP